MRYIDLNTPFASAVIDGGVGLVLSDIFPSDDEYGLVKDQFNPEQLGSMATSELVDIKGLFDSSKRDSA